MTFFQEPCFNVLPRTVPKVQWAGTAQLVERPTEKPEATLMRVRVPAAARDFSPRVNFQCRLLRCPYSPPVQSYASTSVCTLKLPNISSHITIPSFVHREMLHTVIGSGSAALVPAVSFLPRYGDPNFPRGTMKYQQHHTHKKGAGGERWGG